MLCEKPLARRPADVEAAFDAAERAGRVLMEGMMWRLHPRVEALGRLAREAVGEPRTVRATFRFTLPEGPDVRRDPELDGGALMDVGCYCVSALRLLCGEPERVSAEAVIGPTGVDERVVATLRFPGDVLGTLDCAMDAPQHASLELAGTAGRLLVADPWPVPGRVTVDSAADIDQLVRRRRRVARPLRRRAPGVRRRRARTARAAAGPHRRGRAGARARRPATVGGHRRARALTAR